MKLVTKYILSNFGGKVINKKEVERVCNKFGIPSESTINYMINYGFFVRILRGLYYVKTIEEFKLKKTTDVYKLISLGMEKMKVDWYFGLYTSLRLNGLTHEFFTTIFILNDKIFRPKEIKILGEKVKFIKLKSKLFGFGIVNMDGIKFSDPEKTILDFIYVFRYRNVNEERIISMIGDYFKKLEKKKIKEYLKFYPRSVSRVVENAKLV
jgi:predicted transcriptional regulator of viral defense system